MVSDDAQNVTKVRVKVVRGLMQRIAVTRHSRTRQDYDSEFIVGANDINFKHPMLQTSRAFASDDAKMHPRGRPVWVYELKDVLTEIANVENNGAAVHVFLCLCDKYHSFFLHVNAPNPLFTHGRAGYDR
jgi:hypothetical protein